MERGQLYYAEAVRRATEQESARKHFDSMATAVIGFAAVVLGFTSIGTIHVSSGDIWLYVLTLTAFAVVAVSALLCLWLRGWHFLPSLDDLHEHLMSAQYEDEALVLWTAQELSRSVGDNTKYMRRKAYSLRCAYIALSVEVLSVGLLALISFF